MNDSLDRSVLHGRRRLKIRDTIVYECQRLAGRLLRGLDDDQHIDLSVLDVAAETGQPAVWESGRASAGPDTVASIQDAPAEEAPPC